MSASLELPKVAGLAAAAVSARTCADRSEAFRADRVRSLNKLVGGILTDVNGHAAEDDGMEFSSQWGRSAPALPSRALLGDARRDDRAMGPAGSFQRVVITRGLPRLPGVVATASRHEASSPTRAWAAFKSKVSKPSVNQP
jgi:hypothetical protein